MKFTLLIFSILARNSLKMLQQSSFNKRIPDLFSGYDQRYLINRTTTEICTNCNATIINTHVRIHSNDTGEEQFYNFKKMFAQLALLKYITREDESEINKLKAIENHEQEFNDKSAVYKLNLLEGGLFKDWDWDFDIEK
jgi:uncharacterized UBP type Zn finger protein